MPIQRSRRVVIEQGDEPVEKTILAKAIVDISRAALALERGGLTRRAIVLLVSDATKGKVGRDAVGHVLDALRDLEATYCTRRVR